MYQSSTRTNFLDILADPTAIALLGSIALHALIAASLPLFPQPNKDPKKAEPGTVKVVELTPNELQRIPQAQPIPAPQVLTPVTPPTTTPTIKVAPPASNPLLSPNSPAIPFSPIRIPLEKVNPQPVAGNKQQQAIPQQQPTAPIFDPNISFKPTPKSIPKPTTQDVTPKPLPLPKPAPVAEKPRKPTNPDSAQTTVMDDDGGETPPTTQAHPPTQQAQSPTNSHPTPAGNAPTTTKPAQPSGTPGEDRNSFPPFYGKYAASARDRIEQYLKSYPDIKLYKPQSLLQSYPVGVPCSKVKQPPFIVLMAAFDKVPENTENNPLGDSTAPSIDRPFVARDTKDTPENIELGDLAVKRGLEQATEDDKKRPAEDKGKKVLYQYRVQFDPTTCKQ
jgi:hypothetical protein